MIEEGIFEGDIVIVRPEKEPVNGSIAVVLIHDEVTIKKFFREKDKIKLVPANRLLKATLVDPMDAMVLGRVVGVIRKL
jgi:repressor LexA